jgi:hypothetical protein
MAPLRIGLPWMRSMGLDRRFGQDKGWPVHPRVICKRVEPDMEPSAARHKATVAGRMIKAIISHVKAMDSPGMSAPWLPESGKRGIAQKMIKAKFSAAERLRSTPFFRNRFFLYNSF